MGTLFIVLAGVLPPAGLSSLARQLDPDIRDTVTAASVLIAAPVEWTEDGVESLVPFPLGSGTIVSPDGLVLTNHHVVDQTSLDEQIASLQAEIARERPTVVLDRIENVFVLLGSDGSSRPVPRYMAEIAAEDPELDVAVLRIFESADRIERGAELYPTPHVPFGNSDEVNLGDRIQLFAYPAIGGDSLTYTTGVVSGFGFDDASGDRAWIATDAVMSGGSSGGTAINDEGRLIGIPTAGSELDCRPGDTNRDGTIDERDVGCIPVGGSLGMLVPVNEAFDLLVASGLIALAPDGSTEAPKVTIGAAKATEPPSRSSESSRAERSSSFTCDFGFVENFDDPSAFRAANEETRSSEVIDGAIHLRIKSPGWTITYLYSECGTSGAPATFTLSVDATSGWGDVILLVQADDGAVWYFSVDPQTQTWSLYRNSDATGQLFYWVEPMSYAQLFSGRLQTIEVAVANGETSFLINGRTLADSSSQILPSLPGNLAFGFGAGINPYSLSGSGQTFDLVLESIVLSEE